MHEDHFVAVRRKVDLGCIALYGNGLFGGIAAVGGGADGDALGAAPDAIVYSAPRKEKQSVPVLLMER